MDPFTHESQFLERTDNVSASIGVVITYHVNAVVD